MASRATDLPAQREFTWRDAERTILFRAGILAEAGELVTSHEWEPYELLTTQRALNSAPVELPEQASAVHYVPTGPVNEVAGGLIGEVAESSLVALGGGRVIDVAKAIAAVRRGKVAALPTTLSGAEMTRIHRLPDGHDAPGLIRPALVIADPDPMTTLPEDRLRASAMNALAHGAEPLYTPLANPVASLATLRGARLIARALDSKPAERDREGLALGSILCAYALDSGGFALHHVVCQTLVRTLGTPHAETNAAMLPRTMQAMSARAPKAISALARALGTPKKDLRKRIEQLAGGRRRLSELGADASGIDAAVETMLGRPELRLTPDPPDAAELRTLIESAW
ncbi:MAG TPA: iron-containing alcohol dehydrogenase [Solirubrobacterales bacterium]|nr:iron-containing alcohol dehydrogenase [Solirubrobacterales bacterium]